jgi:hypothetical protein
VAIVFCWSFFSFAHEHTAFFSVSLSLASECMELYSRGGILPVDMSQQIDSKASLLFSRRISSAPGNF